MWRQSLRNRGVELHNYIIVFRKLDITNCVHKLLIAVVLSRNNALPIDDVGRLH